MQCFPLVFLYVLLVDAIPPLFSEIGRNVTISCRCSDRNECLLKQSWARITMKGSLESIDVDTEKGSRFLSQSLDRAVELTITRAEGVDTGRYYCGFWEIVYVKFTGEGTSLFVEEEVWTNRSQVILLSELENSEPTHVELRCLVTGLNSHSISVIWRSSWGAEVVGHTWKSTDNAEFSVTSKIRINITSSKDTNVSQNAPDSLEEWWCDVQAGVHVIKRSKVSSLNLMRDHMAEVPPDWCSAVMYSAVAVSLLCMFAISILIRHRILYLCTNTVSGSSSATYSAVTVAQADVQQVVTYAHLDVTQMRKPERPQRERTSTHTYSCVKTASTTRRATSPDLQGMSNLTYAHLDNKAASRNTRRQSEQPARVWEEEVIYSTIKCP